MENRFLDSGKNREKLEKRGNTWKMQIYRGFLGRRHQAGGLSIVQVLLLVLPHDLSEMSHGRGEYSITLETTPTID